MKQSSKTVSSKKLSGLNCISKNPNINPAVSSESSICTWKAELDFRSLYNLCKTKSSFLFSLKSKCKPPTDSSVAELQRIKLACNSETFQDNYQYIKPRTSFFPNGNFLPPASCSRSFSAMWETFVISKKKGTVFKVLQDEVVFNNN